jgi:hypothetical protein
MTDIYLGIDIGIRTLSFCELHVGVDHSKQIRSWGVYDMLVLVPEHTATSRLRASDIHALCTHVLPIIFNRPVHHVCIEQQPLGSFCNPQVVLVSHLVYQFFYQRFMCDGTRGILQSVQYVAPQRKYAASWLTLCGLVKQTNYKKRKLLSVALCSGLLRAYRISNVTGIDVSALVKGDDIADAFLLALACVLL